MKGTNVAKFTVMMKDPDGPCDAIRDAAEESAKSVEGLSEGEREALSETRQESFKAFTNKWLQYGEYVTIEFDTEAGTATIKEVS